MNSKTNTKYVTLLTMLLLSANTAVCLDRFHVELKHNKSCLLLTMPKQPPNVNDNISLSRQYELLDKLGAI